MPGVSTLHQVVPALSFQGQAQHMCRAKCPLCYDSHVFAVPCAHHARGKHHVFAYAVPCTHYATPGASTACCEVCHVGASYMVPTQLGWFNNNAGLSNTSARMHACHALPHNAIQRAGTSISTCWGE